MLETYTAYGIVPATIDYANSVEPFLHQFFALPQAISNAGLSADAWKSLYMTTNPVISGFAFSLALAPIFFVVSEVNKNYSQVDRVWSILPTLYNLHWALYARLAGLPTARSDLAAAVSIIWSCRLTYNYWRRGGYEVGSEDYRWVIVKNFCGSFGFLVLNIIFIATLQSILLYSIAWPGYALLVSVRTPPAELTTLDKAFAGGMVLLIIATTVADQQQWNYQNAKHSYRKTAKVPAGYEQADLDRGFNTNGLFAYSRHPNYAFEQSVWVTYYFWGAVATNSFYNWTALGAIAYLLLFQASTVVTELITAPKYPEYKDYQAQEGMFVSFMGRRYDPRKAKSGKDQKKIK